MPASIITTVKRIEKMHEQYREGIITWVEFHATVYESAKAALEERRKIVEEEAARINETLDNPETV